MTKTSDKSEPVFKTCPDCGEHRLQIHERGTVVEDADGVLTVAYDELALQCLGCHHVFVIPVSGAVEYKA